MNTSKLIIIHFLALLLGLSANAERGQLLKVPRIYNVLLSSNEMLVPSQAYPVVSPVIQPVSSVYLTSRNYEAKEEIHHSGDPKSIKPPMNPIEPVLVHDIKNHKPANPDIPNVPPPPLPVSFRERSNKQDKN